MAEKSAEESRPRLLARFIGVRAFAMGIDREGKRLRHRLAEVEAVAFIFDLVEILAVEFDLLVGRVLGQRFGGDEAQSKRLLDRIG